MGFPDGLNGQESTNNAGDPGLILGSGGSPGGGPGNPFQYSCPENPHGQRSLTATVHKFAELDTTEVTEHTHRTLVK